MERAKPYFYVVIRWNGGRCDFPLFLSKTDSRVPFPEASRSAMRGFTIDRGTPREVLKALMIEPFLGLGGTHGRPESTVKLKLGSILGDD